MIFYNGALLQQNSDYFVSGNTITYTFAPSIDSIQTVYYSTNPLYSLTTLIGSIDGINNAFRIIGTALTEQSLLISLNGAILAPGIDYNLVSSTEVIFNFSPPIGSELQAITATVANQTLFEITNDESSAANLYSTTRFLTVIEFQRK